MAVYQHGACEEVVPRAESAALTWQALAPNMSAHERHRFLLFGRTVNGLSNIWKFGLQDKALSQVTFGTGPDLWPMPDPAGKGLYIVNGKSAGMLTAYNPKTKQAVDIRAENPTQPAMSRCRKRVMYITAPSRDRNELWVSNIDDSNKVRLQPSAKQTPSNVAP